MRTGVVLPQGAQVASLPAFDGFGSPFIAGVRGELVLECPAPDAGAVGEKVEAAMEFTGGGAVGRGGLGGEQLGEQGHDFLGPLRVMVATRGTGTPSVGGSLGTGAEVVSVEFVEAAVGQAQFGGRGTGGELFGTMVGQNVTNERSGKTVDQLLFFIEAKGSRDMDFSLWKLMPAGASRAALRTARPAVYQASGGAQVASPQSPILR